jgi:hypothetical protein
VIVNAYSVITMLVLKQSRNPDTGSEKSDHKGRKSR